MCRRWQLWRQDDNGNRFLIAVFEEHGAAERRLAELECGHHKQIYWICQQTASEGDQVERGSVPVADKIR